MPIVGVLLAIGGATALGAKLYDYFAGDAKPAPEDPTKADETAAPVPSEPTALAPIENVQLQKRPEQSLDEVDAYLTLSSAAFGLALAGFLWWPCFLASGLITAYSTRPLFQRAYHAVFVERRLRASILDSAAMLAALVGGFVIVAAFSNVVYFIGRRLLLKSQDQTRRKLVDLFVERPRTVFVIQDDLEIELPIEALRAGDRIKVSAGQPVPVDGTIRHGTAIIDQRALTGEAQPVERMSGDRVLAATTVVSGCIVIEVHSTGGDTVVAQVGQILNRTADYRAEIESRGERLADQAVLPLLGLSGLALGSVGVRGAATVLSSSFIDNMRIAVPLSMLNFLDRATQLGILVKDGRALELLNQVDTVIFDKTGTLTLEEPHVGQIYTCDGISSDELLSYAAAAEAKQGHPIGRAIVQAAAERGLPLPTSNSAHYEMGYGIETEAAGLRIQVGSARFMAMLAVAIPPEIAAQEHPAHQQGHTLIYVAIQGRLGGAIELRPTIRPEAAAVVTALHRRGLSLHILSGDHPEPTRHLASQLGIEHYFAEVLPADKAAMVADLQRQGKRVCFIGDGINDAIALKQANASISLSGATGIAIDMAQIVMMDGSLRQLPQLFALCAEFDSNMNTGLMINLIPSALCIGGVFVFHVGLWTSAVLLNLSLAASVANAMRPRLIPSEAAHV